MSELNPSDAQRKAMVDMLLEYRDCFCISSAEIVEDMIAAANKASKGAPVEGLGHEGIRDLNDKAWPGDD